MAKNRRYNKITSLHDYIHYLNNSEFEIQLGWRPKNHKLSSEELSAIYRDTKRIFCNPTTYKWSTKLITRFENDRLRFARISREENHIIDILERLFNQYFKEFPNKPGKKGALKFIETLKKSRRVKFELYDIYGPKLKAEASIIEFLTDMKTLNRHFDMSHMEMIRFIHTNFNTGLTLSTLRRYYFDLA